MADSALAGVVCHGDLVSYSIEANEKNTTAYLRVFAGFEEGGDTREAVLIVPHDGVITVVNVFGDAKRVLKHCNRD